ncbi:uncharacterized protein PHACADRAFT_209915 [Phanerochaete carnosa HHB-10118-sp]|uniref:NADP-dependent oxidoreductase domain-containing protein n=1 Tax=Phanerochaete carnosa (strain HHB-10118-sp) TaxID=650164 RepID=K5W572_PHACS|nr:uncharacterized protein PHACADRAFT_209915 [Phanerochaete carnosa HHB-10118-sp]EKM54094.1 hypothetical protein PHACADRAFT_209915 [Phanerochaete carnosa HHB-10118-sp]
MPLPTRKLGNSEVAAIGWGGMGLSTAYGPTPPDEERLAFLDALYASGFKRTGKRNEIFLATKGGFFFQSGRPVNAEPEYIKSAIEKSFARLGVNTIDLYYLHRPDATVPIEKSIAAIAEYVKAGKIKYVGICECSADTLRRANATHPISAVQTEYSLAELIIERNGLLDTCRELGAAVVPFAPLGKGLLTGQYRSPDDFAETDNRRLFPRFSKENFPNVIRLADGLKAIGERHSATAGQVALAWLLGQGNEVIPIPGTKTVKYLEENLGSWKVSLTEEELQEIRVLAEKADPWTGPRFPAWFTAESFIDTPPL